MKETLLVALALSLGAPIAGAEGALAKAPSHHVAFDGIKVHYKSLGSGKQALVFVHGWTCNLGFWEAQAEAFPGRRLLFVDLPGHGASDKPEIAYTMELHARAVEAAMRDAGAEQAVLVGHSMGTPVVWQFYRLFPSKTLALVAVDGSFRSFFQNPADAVKFVERYRGPNYKAVVGAAIDSMMAPGAPPGMRQRIKTEMLATPQHVVVSASLGMTDPKAFTPDPIQVPLLAVYAKSPFWTAEYEAYVRKLAPQADFQVMEGVGHFLMMDDPAGFNARLRAFLDGRGLLKG
jgi:pimeloyl-ACP methyl ester carboxylesterase